MATWPGTGPVFVFECVALARRRQFYLLRTVLVSTLLAVLALTWTLAEQAFGDREELARVAYRFYLGVVIVQMAVVLLAAPAATAGALCVDKTRGTLLHVFATDLRSGEIVLGKLAARLAPVLGLMFSGLPVLALSGLLGGVDPAALFGAYLVTAGVGMVGCALALLLSVWVRKTHEAVLPAYVLLTAWLLMLPAALEFSVITPTPSQFPARLVFAGNPFYIAVAPYVQPDTFGLADQVLFFAGSMLTSALCARMACVWVRPAALKQVARPMSRSRAGWAAKLIALIPGPSLDSNPVLWREWHRKRPSRWSGRFWTVYAVAFGLASAWAIAGYFVAPTNPHARMLAAQINAWEIALGLLLLCVSAASSLSEERDRGSLDVIMATPLPTWTIVLGKWWGTFALVPRLMIFPLWVGSALALVSQRWEGVAWMAALTLAHAAAATSLGLAVATWVRHPARTIGTTVLVCVLVTVGWPVVLLSMNAFFRQPGRYDEALFLGSPFYAVLSTTEYTSQLIDDFTWHIWVGWNDWIAREPGALWAWLVLYVAGASLLFALTMNTFDRSVGRASAERRPRLQLRPAGTRFKRARKTRR